MTPYLSEIPKRRLHEYGGLRIRRRFFATVGLNVYDMWSQRFCEVDGRS